MRLIVLYTLNLIVLMGAELCVFHLRAFPQAGWIGRGISFAFNPILGILWLLESPLTGEGLGMVQYVVGPFAWAGTVEWILRRFVDSRADPRGA